MAVDTTHLDAPVTVREGELFRVIGAYNEVAERLRRTHEMLADQVRRLQEEIASAHAAQREMNGWIAQAVGGSGGDFHPEGRTLEELERETILSALSRHNGHRERTARALGMGVRTLGLKLRKWKEQKLVASTV